VGIERKGAKKGCRDAARMEWRRRVKGNRKKLSGEAMGRG
jgi:hypothetical protein